MIKKEILLVLLFIISGILYYHIPTSTIQENQILITRVIDGDSVVDLNLQVYRLKGINNKGV